MGRSLTFFVWPYMCFSNVASDIFRLLSFLFLGGFHWHGSDVHGMESASSSSATLEEATGNGTRVIAASACNSPDICVHEADFLHV